MGSGFRTFASGETLTSSNVQNFLMDQSVMVFAGTAARGSAIASPEAGMISYRTDGTADSAREGFEFYSGTSWTRMIPAAVPGGLVYLTGASFETATSVSLPTSTFTTTYRNYRMILQVTAVTSDADFTLRMRASGTDNSTSNYDNIWLRTANDGSTSNITNAAQTSWNMGEQDNANIWHSLVLDILSPQIADQTIIHGRYAYINKANTLWFQSTGSGIFRDVTQFDSLSFISSVASSISGVYRVYGYSDS